MIKVGIIGGAGYTAGELIRLLLNHPEAEIVFVNSSSNAGNKMNRRTRRAVRRDGSNVYRRTSVGRNRCAFLLHRRMATPENSWKATTYRKT